MSERNPIWPEKLMIRDTELHDDMGGLGQRIYTTAGQGYEKREYIRADLAAEQLKEQSDHELDLRNSLIDMHAEQIERLEAKLRESAKLIRELIFVTGESAGTDPTGALIARAEEYADKIDAPRNVPES